MLTEPEELSVSDESLLAQEWAILMPHHPNVLVFAPDRPADEVIEELMPVLRQPVRYWNPGAAMSWAAHDVGSLIVRDLAALDATEQAELDRWLNRRPTERVQILSVTSVPLFPRVEHGAFLDALYYRLNVIHLAPGAAPTLPRPATRPGAAGRV
ncbi:MAG: hypothetical protein WBD07_01765 [Vicinamibacterales bacterium]